jgi:hypothetical protein
VEKQRVAKLMIFSRKRLTRKSQTGMQFREHEAALQRQGSVLVTASPNPTTRPERRNMIPASLINGVFDTFRP